MNQKLEKIRDELAGKYSALNIHDQDNNAEAFKQGWNSADPHIRQDERERTLQWMMSKYGIVVAQTLDEELKKMDEAGE